MLDDLLQIEEEVDALSDRATSILGAHRQALAGLLVETWNGRRFHLLGCHEHRGVVTCLGTVASVQKSGRAGGKRGKRGYSIGRLSDLKFVKEGQKDG